MTLDLAYYCHIVDVMKNEVFEYFYRKIFSMKTFMNIVILCLIQIAAVAAQEHQTTIGAETLNDSKIKEFFKSKISTSQFIMVGEQHGIQEAGILTNVLYDIAHPYGFNHLCIETDQLVAELIENYAQDTALTLAREKQHAYPFSIPFYNNSDDYKLFKNVVDKGGQIFGIDQSFMAQFRLSFDYLVQNTTNSQFKTEVLKLLDESIISFTTAMEEKDFMKMYIFNYADEHHKRLLELTNDKKEIEILNQLKESKVIYNLNFKGKIYENNLRRSELMKHNFQRYYDEVNQKEKEPKMIFKLGANHVMRGLNYANVYDVANLASAVATMNHMSSTHIMVKGIQGQSTKGNPFSPISKSSFDNRKDLPKEVQEMVVNMTHQYLILDLSAFRYNAKSFTEEFQDWIFDYDIVVLVKNAKALDTF